MLVSLFQCACPALCGLAAPSVSVSPGHRCARPPLDIAPAGKAPGPFFESTHTSQNATGLTRYRIDGIPILIHAPRSGCCIASLAHNTMLCYFNPQSSRACPAALAFCGLAKPVACPAAHPPAAFFPIPRKRPPPSAFGLPFFQNLRASASFPTFARPSSTLAGGNFSQSLSSLRQTASSLQSHCRRPMPPDIPAPAQASGKARGRPFGNRFHIARSPRKKMPAVWRCPAKTMPRAKKRRVRPRGAAPPLLLKIPRISGSGGRGAHPGCCSSRSDT